MKKRLLTIIALLAAGWIATAETVGIITYVEGWVDLKSGKGTPVEAFIGDEIRTGDSVITGSDGIATIEREGALTINIASDTVFTLQEIDTDTGKETAMAAAVGSVKFKFGKLIGKEPQIRTPSMVAGVRGTEFTVWTAPEGSTLVAVTSGEVAVSAEGATVSLLADEGVSVEPGKLPGEKFSVLGRPLNHKEWAQKKMDEFLEDPMDTLEGLHRTLLSYYREIDDLKAAFEQLQNDIDGLKAEQKQILADEGKEKAGLFYKERIYPVEVKQTRAYANMRYWAVSAYNLKRHALAKTYLVIKTKYLADPDVDVYRDFISGYKRITDEFWRQTKELLSYADV